MSIKDKRIDAMKSNADVNAQILAVQNKIDTRILECGQYFADKILKGAESSLVTYGKSTMYEPSMSDKEATEMGIWNYIIELNELKEGAHREGTKYMSVHTVIFSNPYLKFDAEVIGKLIEPILLRQDISMRGYETEFCGRTEYRHELKVMM